MSIYNTTEWKGHTLLELPPHSNPKYPMKFGIKKVRHILEHLDQLRAFEEDVTKAAEAKAGVYDHNRGGQFLPEEVEARNLLCTEEVTA